MHSLLEKVKHIPNYIPASKRWYVLLAIMLALVGFIVTMIVVLTTSTVDNPLVGLAPLFYVFGILIVNVTLVSCASSRRTRLLKERQSELDTICEQANKSLVQREL